MNKDFDLKYDPQYSSNHLRAKIDEAIKRQRDETQEMDEPQAKRMPIIPVTGTDASAHKYFNNKSPKEF